MKINSDGLWLVKFKGQEAPEVIRVVWGILGTRKEEERLTCREVGNPSHGVIPFSITEKHLEKVFRKIKDPLEIK